VLFSVIDESVRIELFAHFAMCPPVPAPPTALVVIPEPKLLSCFFLFAPPSVCAKTRLDSKKIVTTVFDILFILSSTVIQYVLKRVALGRRGYEAGAGNDSQRDSSLLDFSRKTFQTDGRGGDAETRGGGTRRRGGREGE